MSHTPFRFVHAADFHLERPPGGISEAPEHLRTLFADAPYRAAERVFDLVLSEQADFLVLAGDLLQPEATGPRGPLFLVEQFERLRERGVQVYWAAGAIDAAEHWPAFARLPDNVLVFPERQPEELVHHRDGEPLLRLIGLSRRSNRRLKPSDFPADASGLFSIAVTYGAADRAAMANKAIHYWALGGRSRRETLSEGAGTAHYPGTTQGRTPSDVGPHGCSVVDVDEEGKLRSRLAPTDALRWRDEEVELEEPTARQAVERILLDRLRTIAATSPGLDQIVSWKVTGPFSLIAPLRRGGFLGEALARLRSESGHASPAVWSASLGADSPDVPASWRQQDTILGDFLRTISERQTASADEARRLDLASYLDPVHVSAELADAVTLDDDDASRRILQRAAILGAELLSGEETPS